MLSDKLDDRLILCSNDLITDVLDCAFTVHKELGAGLLESVYEKALLFEMKFLGLEVKEQVEIPVVYRGVDLGIGFRADLIVNNSLLLELKCVENINSTHLAQTITYLKLLNYKRGLILNFNVVLLKNGIKRVSI